MGRAEIETLARDLNKALSDCDAPRAESLARHLAQTAAAAGQEGRMDDLAALARALEQVESNPNLDRLRGLKDSVAFRRWREEAARYQEHRGI